LMARRNLTNHSLRTAPRTKNGLPSSPCGASRHLHATCPPPLGDLSSTNPATSRPSLGYASTFGASCRGAALPNVDPTHGTAPPPCPFPLKHLPPRCCSRRAAKLGGLVRVAGRARGVDPVRRGRPLGRRRHRGLVD